MISEVANIRFHGQNENVHEHDEIRTSEGHVGCVIEQEPLEEESRFSPLIEGGPSDDEVTGYYANVQCTLYPAGPRPDRQVARLRSALARMQANVSASSIEPR